MIFCLKLARQDRVKRAKTPPPAARSKELESLFWLNCHAPSLLGPRTRAWAINNDSSTILQDTTDVAASLILLAQISIEFLQR
jgi:hypothetical protein